MAVFTAASGSGEPPQDSTRRLHTSAVASSGAWSSPVPPPDAGVVAFTSSCTIVAARFATDTRSRATASASPAAEKGGGSITWRHPTSGQA